MGIGRTVPEATAAPLLPICLRRLLMSLRVVVAWRISEAGNRCDLGHRLLSLISGASYSSVGSIHPVWLDRSYEAVYQPTSA